LRHQLPRFIKPLLHQLNLEEMVIRLFGSRMDRPTDRQSCDRDNQNISRMVTRNMIARLRLSSSLPMY